MSIATVVTRGYGSFGSIAFIVTRGYSIGEVVVPVFPHGRPVSALPAIREVKAAPSVRTVDGVALSRGSGALK